ncbi:MAG: hypothetical protein AB9828_09080 [Sphaerochaetaceae bacterium]
MKRKNLRLATGLLILPALLFQSHPLVLLIQVIHTIILALTHGRKFKLLPNLLVLCSVSLANLIQPNGLRLFSIGSFPITAGAMVLGAHRALTLIGLLYLSQYMVTGKPSFPGKMGRLLAMQFYYFERITTQRGMMERKDFIASLDRLLFSLDQDKDQDQETIGENQGQAVVLQDWAVAAVNITIAWILLAVGNSGLIPALM